MKEIYWTNIVSQIKQEVIVEKRKSQKPHHFDANTDMSKLLTGVTTRASKASQRLIFLIIIFCVITNYYTTMCMTPMASDIQTAKKKSGYIYLNSQVANKSFKKTVKWTESSHAFFFFLPFFLLFFLQNWKSMLTCNLVYFTGGGEWKWDQEFCPPWSWERPFPIEHGSAGRICLPVCSQM